MSLERIVVKGNRTTDEMIRDKVFYSLVKVMVNDYSRIQDEYKDYVPYEVGKEFTTHLHGALILLEPSDRDIKNYCRKILHFDPIDLYDADWVSKLEANLEGDGARIVKDNKLVCKAGVYALLQAEKKKGKEISELIRDYIIPSMNFTGERVTAALAFSIATKKYSYIISQTIQPTQKDINVDGKEYSKVGTGKVKEFGPKGLVRMVKLENGSQGVPAEHMIDKDVYIRQSNYNFNKSIHLTSENYLTLQDLDLLSSGRFSKKGFKDMLKELFKKIKFKFIVFET